MLTPYDPTRYLNRSKESYFRSLLEEGKILQSDGIDAIYEDVVSNIDQISHPAAFEQIKNKNLLVFGAQYDSISPINEMVLPLWNQIEKYKKQNEESTEAKNLVQKMFVVPTEHGLLGRRNFIIKEIAEFIEKVENTAC